MRKTLFSLLFLATSLFAFANDDDSLLIKLKQYTEFIDSVNSSMKYATGEVSLPNGVARLNVPQGFKYLNAEQSKYVIEELWGNPPQTGILGMIFPENGTPFVDSSYAFVITFSAIGYVKDEDADKIDYDDLLKQIQKEEIEENRERVKMGYSSIHLVGWAQKPFYDKTNKVLHWAKELEFGDAEDHTLNYEVRILGRKGILSLNAVATMNELAMVKNDINKVLHIAEFTAGNKYSDFDSGVDDVAAWTIGGLVAGKVLAKAGFFAIILKAWKFILIGLVAAGAAIKKFFKRNRTEEITYDPTPNPDNTNS